MSRAFSIVIVVLLLAIVGELGYLIHQGDQTREDVHEIEGWVDGISGKLDELKTAIDPSFLDGY